MAARLRKHFLAFATLAAFHFIFFFPVMFMGRVVSPNDVFYNYQPWATYRPASLRIQNTLLNDPPTAYLPLMSLAAADWDAFHWDPFVGGGIPGFGSSGAAVLSPFVLLPSLLVPMSWVYTAMLLLKLNVAFWFAYAWLREERIGKRGAAIGAIVIAASGIYTVRWLWQITNATALYPALLWVVRRVFSGKKTSIAVVALIALSYALAGFPAAMAYGAWVVVLYAVYLAITSGRRAGRAATAAGTAALLGGLVAAPAIVPFVQFIRRSGYLDLRAKATEFVYPLHHWRSFIDPQRLGNNAAKTWVGDPSLPINNFIEATIYVGVITIALAIIAIIARQRAKWFWLATALIVLAAMFGHANVLGALPGFKYSPLERVALLLPIPMGFLAGSGAAFIARHTRRFATVVTLILGVAVAADLATFASSFHPYLRPADTEVAATPTIRFLQQNPKPFRFVAFLGYMWPNAAELYRIEDTSSHFGSEAAYRRLLKRIDSQSWLGKSTVITFNSLSFNFRDPLVSMLGVRYLLEHRAIDIVKWTIFGATVPGAKETGAMRVFAGQVVQRTITVDAEPFWAIELPVSVERTFGVAPSLHVDLLKDGRVVWSRIFAASDVDAMDKIYIPLHSFARLGESVTVRVQPQGMTVSLLKAGQQAYYGRVTIPLIFDRELPDGRIFRNLAEVPRFHAVTKLRKLNADEFLATKDIDFANEAVITDDPVFPPATLASDARAQLVSYKPSEQRIRTDASGTMFLASSEKLTPELRISIDGKTARPIQINTLFAGVIVPGGHHDVLFERRIGRGWWPTAILAAFAIIVIGAAEATSALRR